MELPMAYHLHHILILTKDDAEGESIGEVLREHCSTLGAEGSNLVTFNADRFPRAVAVEAEDLAYDLDLSDMREADTENDPQIGTAIFQGEAWIGDHALPVDDARWTYPITEAEYAEAFAYRDVQAFDGLQEAVSAPRAVKNWPGPFTIIVDFGARKPAVARFIEDPEQPDFDPDEIAATKAAARYNDAEWAALSLAEQATILDLDHRR